MGATRNPSTMELNLGGMGAGRNVMRVPVMLVQRSRILLSRKWPAFRVSTACCQTSAHVEGHGPDSDCPCAYHVRAWIWNASVHTTCVCVCGCGCGGMGMKRLCLWLLHHANYRAVRRFTLTTNAADRGTSASAHSIKFSRPARAIRDRYRYPSACSTPRQATHATQ